MVQNHIREDEIDLRELFLTLWEKKIFITIFTLVTTTLVGIYALMQNPTPIYEGKLYLEIGKIHDKNFAPVLIENPNNLSRVLNLEFGVQSNTSKGTSNIIEVSFLNEDKELIKNKLESARDFTISKHMEETSFYTKAIMTKQIGGGISILDEAVNKPKKMLMLSVGFVTGFTLSIFLVFFMQFIRGFKTTNR
ncbi:MAG: Wzz/FepE/Etk N-terminal domain-containing protein [Sulfurimonadaceae bacterium]|jgi:capsular polysaccharide biosynthesis protein|nr:Wzz/FepE/Etk N-terminal domain-containing protein [Sulfurimonadaceae bacterium]